MGQGGRVLIEAQVPINRLRGVVAGAAMFFI